MTNIEWTEETLNVTAGCTKVSTGCKNCLDPLTMVLNSDFKWVTLDSLNIGDEILGFDEYVTNGVTRKLRKVKILNKWYTKKDAYKIKTLHNEIIASGRHKFLSGKASQWLLTDNFSMKTKLRTIGPIFIQEQTYEYKVGYLNGLTDADGSMFLDLESLNNEHRERKRQNFYQIVMGDKEPISRAQHYFEDLGINLKITERKQKQGKRISILPMLQSRSDNELLKISDILEYSTKSPKFNPELKFSEYFMRGYIGGFFDGAGSFEQNGKSLRISNTNELFVKRIEKFLSYFDFELKTSVIPRTRIGYKDLYDIRLKKEEGSTHLEKLRFFIVFSPSCLRKAKGLIGTTLHSYRSPVLSIKNVGQRNLIDIETESGTFIANGFLTHNCYAEKMHNIRLKAMGSKKYQQPFDVIVEHRDDKGNMHSVFDDIWKNQKPTLYFVNSMSDLFHKEVSTDWIYTTMHNLMSNDQHIFQILTKRPERIIEFENSTHDTSIGPIKGKDLLAPHIWMGTSVEDQKSADKRIPHLLKSSAHIKFLSCEPLLGPLDLSKYLPDLDWIIVGGECLTKDAIISTPNGNKKITEIKKGDLVYSYSGKITTSEPTYKMKTFVKTELEISKVINLWENGVKPISQLHLQSRKIKATSKHKFLKLTKTPRNFKTTNRYSYDFEWTELSDLQKGDKILIQKKGKDIGSDDRFSIDKMKIFGCFLGDGWLRLRKAGGGEVSFALPEFSAKREKYVPLIEKEWDVKVKYEPTKKVQLHAYKKSMAEKFRALGFDKKALKKRIPLWVWNTSHDHKKAFIEGYLDTDGHVDKKTGSWAFETPNRELIEDLWSLCLDVGYHPTTIYSRSRVRGEWVLNGKTYNYDVPTTSFLFKVSQGTRNYKSFLSGTPKPIINGLKNGFFALDVVNKIEHIDMKETYDLEIEGTHNYIADGIVVHNSGKKDDIREFDLEWARDIRMQCFKYSTPFFFKQSGTLLPCTTEAHKKCSKEGCTADPCKNRKHKQCGAKGCTFLDGVKYKEMPRR